MAKLALITEVVELAKLHADAIAKGNTKKAKECAKRITDKHIHRMIGCEDKRLEMAQIQWELECAKMAFDSAMMKQATSIEGWGTNFSCKGEFTLWVLVGPNGYMSHRMIRK